MLVLSYEHTSVVKIHFSTADELTQSWHVNQKTERERKKSESKQRQRQKQCNHFCIVYLSYFLHPRTERTLNNIKVKEAVYKLGKVLERG